MAAGAQDEAAVADLVASLDAGDVAGLLVRAALDHDDVAQAVRLAAATDVDRLQVLRAAVDGGLRTRRFLDYWASSRWAADAAPVVDALRVEAEQRPSRDLAGLLERAIGHLVKVLMHADDSNGQIGSLAQDLLEVHVTVCDTEVADPAKLAKWIVRFTFDDQDFFVVDPVRYATALGDTGLATYRSEVARRATTPSERGRSFADQYATERLAVIDRDVSAVIELLGGDLSSPHQFVRVAAAMLELDDSDAALSWVHRGIAETRGWQVAKLYDLAASVLTERGDDPGVFELRLHHHERMPSSCTYNQLKTAAVMSAAGIVTVRLRCRCSSNAQEHWPPPVQVWADDRVTIRDSPLEGRGLFTIGKIAEGEVVLRLGGRLVDGMELDRLLDVAASDPDASFVDTITVFENAHLVLPAATMLHFANHSCDPHLWHTGPYELAARRTIAGGEELTLDYGASSGADGFVMVCGCGSGICRGQVTSQDWQLAELRHRYRGHWTPALQDRTDRS